MSGVARALAECEVMTPMAPDHTAFRVCTCCGGKELLVAFHLGLENHCN